MFTDGGEEYVAQFLISGAGALHIPSLPDIPGLDRFDGPVFHSAQWDHAVDLDRQEGRRGRHRRQRDPVGARVKLARQVSSIQRTAAVDHAADRPSVPGRERRAFAIVPGLRAGLRAGIYWSREQLGRLRRARN